MRAIILAAGIGSRLRPITDNLPKALVEVGGRPILAYQLDALLEVGIQQVVVCTGHMGAAIAKRCNEDYPDADIKFVENEAYLTTNNMFSLYLAREYLDGDVIVLNGDVCFDAEVLRQLLVEEGSSVAVDTRLFNEESMKVVVDQHVRDIAKTIPKEEAFGCSIDVYKFVARDVELIRTALVPLIESGEGRREWFEVLLQRLFRSDSLHASPAIVRGRWMEIDDTKDLNAAEKLFNPKFSELADRKVFFFDRDGTLTLGDRLIEGAAELLRKLRRCDIPYFVVTNNSSRTPSEHLSRMSGLTVAAHEVVISTDTAIEHIRRAGIQRAFVSATASVRSYFADHGIIHATEDAQAVVLTYNSEITYSEIVRLVELVRGGLPYFATHIDLLYPYERGFLPDIGSFINMIELATNRRPDMTFGKPNVGIVDFALQRLGRTRSEAVVVGDRLYTDIALAQGTELTSVLVLTGETRREDLLTSQIKPDVVIDGVLDLIPLFEP